MHFKIYLSPTSQMGIDINMFGLSFYWAIWWERLCNDWNIEYVESFGKERWVFASDKNIFRCISEFRKRLEANE
jgi:hypothetical protein